MSFWVLNVSCKVLIISVWNLVLDFKKVVLVQIWAIVKLSLIYREPLCSSKYCILHREIIQNTSSASMTHYEALRNFMSCLKQIYEHKKIIFLVKLTTVRACGRINLSLPIIKELDHYIHQCLEVGPSNINIVFIHGIRNKHPCWC